MSVSLLLRKFALIIERFHYVILLYIYYCHSSIPPDASMMGYFNSSLVPLFRFSSNVSSPWEVREATYKLPNTTSCCCCKLNSAEDAPAATSMPSTKCSRAGAEHRSPQTLITAALATCQFRNSLSNDWQQLLCG